MDQQEDPSQYVWNTMGALFILCQLFCYQPFSPFLGTLAISYSAREFVQALMLDLELAYRSQVYHCSPVNAPACSISVVEESCRRSETFLVSYFIWLRISLMIFTLIDQWPCLLSNLEASVFRPPSSLDECWPESISNLASTWVQWSSGISKLRLSFVILVLLESHSTVRTGLGVAANCKRISGVCPNLTVKYFCVK